MARNKNFIVYQFWTENNPLTENRKRSLELTKIKNIKFKLITQDNLKDYIKTDYPLHPAYNFLSAVHKSDYLRCYFMHLYGNGYADIKPYTAFNNWEESFKLLNNNKDIDVIGSVEYINGINHLERLCKLPNVIHQVIACNAFICRPDTEFTFKWFNRVNQKLNDFLPKLKLYPSFDNQGENTKYPIKLSGILSEIFHPLCVEYYKEKPGSIRNTLITGRNRTVDYR